LLIHYKNSQFPIKIKVIITKGKLLSYVSDETSCKVLLGYGIAIANGCFYHDIFAATNFSALSLRVMTNTTSVLLFCCFVVAEQGIVMYWHCLRL
jgi:hypothetical protein